MTQNLFEEYCRNCANFRADKCTRSGEFTWVRSSRGKVSCRLFAKITTVFGAMQIGPYGSGSRPVNFYRFKIGRGRFGVPPSAPFKVRIIGLSFYDSRTGKLTFDSKETEDFYRELQAKKAAEKGKPCCGGHGRSACRCRTHGKAGRSAPCSSGACGCRARAGAKAARQ